MRHLLLTCVFALLAAMTSGCGGANSNNACAEAGGTGLSVCAGANLASSSIDTAVTIVDLNSDGIITSDEVELLATDTMDIVVTVIDKHNQYASLPQGVRFDRYTIDFTSNVASAPVLAQQEVFRSITVLLNGGHSVEFTEQGAELFGLELKGPFAAAVAATPPAQDPVSYRALVTMYGEDLITGTAITASFSVNLEIGDFCTICGG